MNRHVKIKYYAVMIACLVVVLIVMNALLYAVPEDMLFLFMWVPLIVYVLVLTGVRKLLLAHFSKKVYGYISYLETECDPQKFLDASRNYARGFRRPYNTEALWFLSYYSRALAENGQVAEGAKLYDDLRASLATLEGKPQMQAAGYVCLAPLTRLYLGGNYALQALEQAESILRKAGMVDKSPRGLYAEWERKCLTAQRDGRLSTLAKLMRESADSEECSHLARAECAERESWVYQAIGDIEAERERLQFVIEHGGKLSCAKRAKARLAAL